MKFKPGDRVSFINENWKGVVTAVLPSGEITVKDESGFEISCRENEIVFLSDAASFGNIENFRINQKHEKKVSPFSKEKKNTNEIWEVDLHYEELEEKEFLSGNHEKLSLQLKHFRKIMDIALQQGIKKVVFIHGVGKGILKQEIIREMKNYEGLKFYNAPQKQYGFGAIVVELI